MPHLESELYNGYRLEKFGGMLVSVFTRAGRTDDEPDPVFSEKQLERRITDLKAAGVYADVSVPALHDLREQKTRLAIMTLAFLPRPQ